MKTLSVKYKLLILVLPVFFLQGCIEIVERIDVNDDRSGNLSLTVNVRQNSFLRDVLNIGTGEMLEDVEALARVTAFSLITQDGISNVKVISDKRRGVAGLSFDFDNHRNLNRALYAMAGEKKTIFKPAVYRVRNQSVMRRNITTLIEALIEEEEGLEISPQLITFTTEINLPGPAKRISGGNARTYDNGYRIRTSEKLSVILDEKNSTRIRVRF